MIPRASALLLPLLLSCANAPALPQDPPAERARTERREEILEIAFAYAAHEWSASERNVFHGEDERGQRVDTPDTSFDPKGWKSDGSVNVGIPYQWGGFSSLEEFDAGIAAGAWAGHVPTTDQSGATTRAVGVDCSGYVARCFDLPQKQSTRSLANICYELESYDELLPGDLLNAFDQHVVLFVEWTDEERGAARVLEAARLRVQESVYPTAQLERRGFRPLRYKPLDPRWVRFEPGEPAFSAEAQEPGAGRWEARRKLESSLEGLPSPLTDAAPGEWARYEVRTTMRPEERSQLRTLAERGAHSLRVQTETRMGGKLHCNDASLPCEGGLLELLIHFASFDQTFYEPRLEECTVEEGSFTLAGNEFAARRLAGRVEASLLMRGVHYPLRVELECILSDEVPLEGVLRATYAVEVDFGQRGAWQLRRGFQLAAFGRGAPR